MLVHAASIILYHFLTLVSTTTKIDSFFAEKTTMITAAIINSLNKSYILVAIYDTYAILVGRLGHYTYVSHNDVIKNYPVPNTLTMLPGYQFHITLNEIKDHREPLSKKWTAEHRVSEIIDYNVHGNYIISIYDTYIMYGSSTDDITYITNDKIYHKKHGIIRQLLSSVFGSSIICSMTRDKSSQVNDPYILADPLVSQFEYYSHKMDHIDIYTAIINARARGLRYSTAFSDIIIDHYQN